MGVWFIVIPEGTADEFACCEMCNMPLVNKSQTNLEKIMIVPCCDVVNVKHGPSRHIEGSTGEYYICDITCKRCDTEIGWFHEYASNPSEKYVENSFVLLKSSQH